VYNGAFCNLVVLQKYPLCFRPYLAEAVIVNPFLVSSQ